MQGQEPKALTESCPVLVMQERLDRLRCAEEATTIRFKPLGQDRRRNRYWRFVQSEGPAEDPTQGRIFVEDAVTGQWALIDSQEGAQILIDTLMQRVRPPLHPSCSLPPIPPWLPRVLDPLTVRPGTF